MKLVWALLSIVLLGSVITVAVLMISLSPTGDPHARHIVMIQEGTPFSLVVERLYEKGIIRSLWAMRWLAWVKGVDRKIIPGEYEFVEGIEPSAILDKLVSGQVIQHAITIPEGYTTIQIADLLHEKQIVNRQAFLKAVGNSEFIRNLELQVSHLEGYLFPDTYFLTRPMTAEAVIKRLVERMKQTLTVELLARADEIGMTTHEVLTLASVIEKETGKPEERGLISGVFHNRLKRNIPLQSDPTVIYALEMYDGNLRKRDLSVKSPYNTYRIKGLPPGPIANPGEAAIRAALYPVPTNFLYFVSRNDGSHKFSATLAEHNSAVKKYQVRQARRAS